MSWLDNPLANMYGPHFLLLYAAVAVVTLIALWLLLRKWDPTTDQPAPPVPTEPDPYTIAYLRGGLEEVARVAVLELVQRGCLAGGEQGFFEAVPDPPELRRLTAVPRAVYAWFEPKGALSARDVFDPEGLVAELRDRIEPTLREPLVAERLLATEKMEGSRLRLTAGLAGLLIALGGYKLTVALIKGHTNVLFLILLLLAAVAANLVIGLGAPPLTARGRKYLDALKLAFNQLNPTVESTRASYYLPLIVGLFGSAALAGTSYAFYADELDELQRTVTSSGGGGSGACGSSCAGGGDGCGGGCGGCGGCG